jgi:hypothetical protein
MPPHIKNKSIAPVSDFRVDEILPIAIGSHLFDHDAVDLQINIQPILWLRARLNPPLYRRRVKLIECAPNIRHLCTIRSFV